MRILIVVVSLLVWGCPRNHCPTTPHTDPDRMMRMHRSLTRTVRALRAEARVEQHGRQGRLRGTVLLFLQRPDRVRFDAITQLGPVAVLTTDGEQFQLLDHRNDAFLEGPACPENVARFLAIHMSGADVARFLVGDTPRLETDDVSLACGEEGYTVELSHPDGRRQTLVYDVREGDEDVAPDQQHLRLRSSEMRHPDGRTDWRATYDDYQVVRDPTDDQRRGVAFPFVVRFVDPDLDADTTVRIKEVDLLEEPPAAEVFRQTPPPGMTPQYSACQ